MLLIFAAVKKSGLPNGARWASSKNQLRNAPCQQQGFSERDQPTSTRCRWWFTMIHCDMSVLWTDISTSPKNVSWLMVMVDDVLRSCWRTSNDWSRSTAAYSGGGRVDETFFSDVSGHSMFLSPSNGTMMLQMVLHLDVRTAWFRRWLRVLWGILGVAPSQ